MGHWLRGFFATLRGRETLLNKTLTTPTIADFTNATHDHSNAAGGGTLSYTPRFTSGNQAVTFSSALNVAHGLGSKPNLVQVALKCTTAEANWSIGDEIIVESAPAGTQTQLQISTDATNVVIRTAGSFTILDKTAFTAANITAANWVYIVRAW